MKIKRDGTFAIRLPAGTAFRIPLVVAFTLLTAAAGAPAQSFTQIDAGLPGIDASSAAWGDYDNDGRLDIVLAGWSGSNLILQVWGNTGSDFAYLEGLPYSEAWLTGVGFGSVAWGDYDNDGRLDILLTGDTSDLLDYNPVSQLWRNTGNGFSVINAGLPGVCLGSGGWGDYNNDGRLDILLTGYHGDWGGVPLLYCALLRNVGSGFNIDAHLSGVCNSSAAWGDYDNDGLLDIVLTGSSDRRIAEVWRNTGSGFTNIDAGLPGVWHSSVAWGDYDNDGRLDLVLTGTTDSNRIAQVWRNTSSGFTNIQAGLPGVYGGSVAWGDYDNDGRLDILLTGTTNGMSSGAIAQVWRNTSSGFTNIEAGLPGVYHGSVAWGDYDNDRRLDILLTGRTQLGRIAQVWRNIGPVSNTLPATPTGLRVTVDGETAALSWNASSDEQTPADTLTYTLRVGTSPGGSDILSPQADASTGFRRLPGMGNAQLGLTATLTDLPPRTYYWSVQAVDGAFAGSPFAAEGSWLIRPPQLTGWMDDANTFVIRFPSQLGLTYRVEYTDSLKPTEWLPLADGLTGTGDWLQVTNACPESATERFYRVALITP